MIDETSQSVCRIAWAPDLSGLKCYIIFIVIAC